MIPLRRVGARASAIPRRFLRLLAVLVLAVAGFSGGPSLAHAATTRSTPAKYNYDRPAAFVLGADSSPLRLGSHLAVCGVHLYDLGSLRSLKRAGVAAKAGALSTLYHYSAP